MSKAFTLAAKLDRIGLRRPLSWIATLTRPGQRFSVDASGNWVNEQPECTIVSPTIHTTPFEQMQAWVLDTWCINYVPRAGDVVIDVGSGVGEEAIVFSSLVGPTGRVLAIEAHPTIYRCLEQSLRRSGAANVVARNCAIADRDGQMTISTSDNHLENSVIGGGPGQAVEARSLDSLTSELGMGDIAFLKMNIEGAEKLAVKGMTKLAPRIRNLCISCHDFLADRSGDDRFRSREAVQSFLESAGFQVSTRDWTPDMPWRRDYLFATRDG